MSKDKKDRKKKECKEDKRDIAFCRIFPPIGVARVGNSPDGYFLGPEVPGPVSEPKGGYKDASGRMKKQAVRFRIYAFDADGNVLSELTANDAEIDWRVSLANKKAEWWPFAGTRNVQRILENELPPVRRNATIEGDEREKLMIEAEPTSIGGKEQVGPLVQGRFLDYPAPVTLGQCRTDDAGRLIVTGGDGKADTTLGKDATFLVSYANNDWWFDDTADGPVTAEVKVAGKKVEVTGSAWVIVAPPDFSPHTQNVVPLYDAMVQSCLDLELAWPESELGPKPDAADPVSFLNDIYPVLRRTSDYRWVNERANRAHGRGRMAGFIDFDTLATLANPEEARKPGSPQAAVFKHVRNPEPSDEIEAANQANLSFMPLLSGDEGTIRPGAPDRWLKLTKLQYEKLRRWSEGDFVNDFPASAEDLAEHDADIVVFDSIRLADQPRALTRAALEACEGGAFFPGIEITSIVRHASFYAESLRVGETYEPGDVTKWMALPWQADFNDCSDNWWPAVRPDDVIEEGYYQEIVDALGETTPPGGLYRLLTRRAKWTHGLGVRYGGLEFAGPPQLPVVQEGMSVESFKEYAERTLRRFVSFYMASVPSPEEAEFDANYLRRVRNFVSRTIGGADISVETTPVNDILRVISEYVTEQLKLKPAEGNVADYRRSENTRLRQNPVAAGVFDIVWRWQNEDFIAAKNELVEAWPELGVVSKRTAPNGDTILVATERDKYTRLPWREYFYRLMNIEQYPDFMPKARELAEEFLASGRAIMRDQVGPLRTFFPYSKATLDARLEAIYEANRQGAVAFDPAINPGIFNTEEKLVERIRQLGPFNQLDGGWLQRITPPGNASKIQSLLFRIWSDELGNGDPAQNHANIYTDLMRTAGIYYPDIRSKDYAENPEIWDDMFSGPVYHTAISLFPETYFPELIGMTLYLEWEANDLQRMVDLYEYYGYPSLFYKLHVAIDNTIDGHGADAKRIVELYLDEVRTESGESGVQEHWERIWTGYISFAFGGIQRWSYYLENPQTPTEKVVDMIERKRHYGALAHNDRKLGPSRINSLFDEPRMFLDELRNSNFIVPGNPDASPLLKLTEPDGVMFRIFTEDEIAIWKEWIRTLPAPPDGTALDSGAAVVVLLRRMAGLGIGAPEHERFTLRGPDPSLPFAASPEDQQTVTESVTWWFQLLRRQSAEGLGSDHHPIAFMRALSDPHNGWIAKGHPRDSRLVTQLLADGPMGRRLRETRPLLGGVRGTDVLIRWISEGCPDPETVERQAQLELAGLAAEIKDRSASESFSARVEELQGMRPSVIPQGGEETPHQDRFPRGPAMGSVQ